jgi:hypothetical protein
MVGKVAWPLSPTDPDQPEALVVRAGFLGRHRSVVPADRIDEIDPVSGVIGLRVDRRAVRDLR